MNKLLKLFIRTALGASDSGTVTRPTNTQLNGGMTCCIT